jgi:hypothetical protein
MSLLHLHNKVSDSVGFCFHGQAHPLYHASYAVSVRQGGTLPSASFRFHLAMDTLAVRLMVPTAMPIADFHRQVISHVGRTKLLLLMQQDTGL